MEGWKIGILGIQKLWNDGRLNVKVRGGDRMELQKNPPVRGTGGFFVRTFL